MGSLQGSRLRKSRYPLLALASSALGVQQTTERRSSPLNQAHSIEPRHRQSPSIRSNRSNHEQEIERLRTVVKQVLSSEASLRAEVDRLEQSLEQTLATQSSLKRDYKKRLARTASIEVILHQEIETLQASLTRSTSNVASLKREIKAQRSQAASTELSLRRKIEELKESLVIGASVVLKLKEDNKVLKESLVRSKSTVSKLKGDNEVLKTTFTHALTSERDMRISAREAREECEKVEKSLLAVISTLRLELEIKGDDIKEEKVASPVQQTIQEEVRTDEDTIALNQPHMPLEGSSDIHILLDDLALQSLAIGRPIPTPHSTSDALGSSLLPEFTALERATKGLQQAVNSELRRAYAGECWSSRCAIPQRSANVARNLRLLVVLWEASGVEELLGSVTSTLRDTPPTMGGEDCAICTDPLLPEHRIVVEGCGHAMCKGCLREYIGARLGEMVWPVRCPMCMAEGGPERRVQTITRILVDELVLPTTVLSQWTDFELSQFIIPITCPKCDKPNLFELAEYNRSTILICNHGCEGAWCRDCSHKVNVEAPHDCADAALEELAGERKWMRCPRPSCRVMVEKNVGCNHITCRCGTHFCYLCGEDITGRVMNHACLNQP